MESSGRAHSVPCPAFGGAMLTLLRVRRVARLRRRPELDGASRPLHRAGSWQPSSCKCKGRPRARQARARVGSCSFPNPTSSPYWAARRELQRAEATAPIAQLEEPIIRNDGVGVRIPLAAPAINPDKSGPCGRFGRPPPCEFFATRTISRTYGVARKARCLPFGHSAPARGVIH
jgi:hypothetical protein